MTPKLLNYLFLSAGGPILSLDKRPYDPLSCHWAGGPMLGGRAGERARAVRSAGHPREREAVSNTMRFT